MISVPPRSTLNCTVWFGRVPSRTASNDFGEKTDRSLAAFLTASLGFKLTALITSPGFRPASAAGVPGPTTSTGQPSTAAWEAEQRCPR